MKHDAMKPSSRYHRPGCLTNHESRYIEGNSCAYRWHAAKRARAEGRLEYIDSNAVTRQRWFKTEERLGRLEDWARYGKAKKFRNNPVFLTFTLDSFTTGWWPWDNQVHHIIPYGSLEQLLEDIAQQAEPRHQRAFDVIARDLLREPYNINDEPNVMVLPVRDADAVAMGLPRHLLGTGQQTVSHPFYSDAVKRELGKRVKPRYAALVAAIKAKKHPRRARAPAVRPVLEALSVETYEEILGMTAVRRARGAANVCLDSIASLLYR